MRIEKLAPSTKVQGRWLCHLDDGSILRVGEGEVVSFALYSGMELDEATYEALTAAVQKSAVRERALNLIAARPLSRRELLEKLTAKPRDPKKEPADPAEAEAVADWLEELGYLDDARYARSVVEHYSAKGYGERKLRDELWRRGVPREYWADALETQGDPAEAIDRFLEQKLRGWSGDRRELKRVTDALARKGFSWSEISDALGRYEIDSEG